MCLCLHLVEIKNAGDVCSCVLPLLANVCGRPCFAACECSLSEMKVGRAGPHGQGTGSLHSASGRVVCLMGGAFLGRTEWPNGAE